MAAGKSSAWWGGKAAVSAVFCLVGVMAGTGLYFADVAYVGPLSNTTCAESGPTLVLPAGGDCVGVTDGSYAFAPSLEKAESMIEAENRWVRNSGRFWVSVAYVMPISAAGSAESVKAAAEQLEGAYTAQYYANRHNVQGTVPMIQLLVASSGTQAAEYSTTDMIIKGDVVTQHLVAVAGIGTSLDTTLAEVRDLTASGIPVIGSTITSDAFDRIPDLVRVAPSGTQEVSGVLAYIKRTAITAFLITDANPADSYDDTLAAGFERDFPDKSHSIIATESYSTAGDVNGSGAVAEQVANRIGQMPTDICVTHPNVVLFAGRAQELAALISDLDTRPCLSSPVTILTGDDAADILVTPLVRSALNSGVTLDYADEANPSEWDLPETGSKYKGISPTVIQQGRQGFLLFRAAFSSYFPLASANDGNAMMGYDATLTGITSIRLAGVDATTANVAQDFSAIQGRRAVPGASGPIMFSPSAQGSNPVGKVIPVLQLSSSGVPRLLTLES